MKEKSSRKVKKWQEKKIEIKNKRVRRSILKRR
jgi:hypothetical protein